MIGGPSPPAIDSVEPAEGPSTGGTLVVVRGQNFTADSAVTMGGRPLADSVVVGPTEIQGATPAGKRGRADVVVASPAGRATLEGGFAFFDPYLRGNVNGDASRDISDAIWLLNWLFIGGPPPPCGDVARINPDLREDLSDAVFLLDFLFKGGPAPSPDDSRCY
ncbi:MAG: IPT/TIG domain-containing protein [Planctomycetes bacterium]|nr:IPT/TIG domain-containing protein [Planctomycetota bacterium]